MKKIRFLILAAFLLGLDVRSAEPTYSFPYTSTATSSATQAIEETFGISLARSHSAKSDCVDALESGSRYQADLLHQNTQTYARHLMRVRDLKNNVLQREIESYCDRNQFVFFQYENGVLRPGAFRTGGFMYLTFPTDTSLPGSKLDLLDER